MDNNSKLWIQGVGYNRNFRLNYMNLQEFAEIEEYLNFKKPEVRLLREVLNNPNDYGDPVSYSAFMEMWKSWERIEKYLLPEDCIIVMKLLKSQATTSGLDWSTEKEGDNK